MYDTADFGGALNLRIPDTSRVDWVAGGLDVTAATTILSKDVAKKLTDALAANGQMSIQLVFLPANVSQAGPANIASYSDGSSLRNFTVGQEHQQYDFRLRTSDGSTNGTPDVDSDDVLTTAAPTNLIISYDGENVLAYRNENTSPEVTSARTGDFSNWSDGYRFMLANETTGTQPWLGTLYRVAIYDRAFNAQQAGNVFEGQDPGGGIDQTWSITWVEPTD